MKLIERFARTKVLIIGDVMLDRYWWGDVTRISPEAPVPVVRLQKDTYVPGGAANVAMNSAGLGAHTILVGLIGGDPDAARLRDELGAAGVSGGHLTISDDRPTNVKTRIIAHSQQVVRVDREITSPLSAAETSCVIDSIVRAMDDADVVLISDYAKGLLSAEVLAHIFTCSKKAQKQIVVDPKGKDYGKYRGAAILTPNRKEAAEACNLEPESDDLVETAGRMLLDQLELDAILITESEHGMTLFERGKGSRHYEAASKEVYDVTGAGDTVAATLAVALASGASFQEASRLANIAAGIVVQQIGTASITIDKLDAVLRERSA